MTKIKIKKTELDYLKKINENINIITGIVLIGVGCLIMYGINLYFN